MTNEEAFKLAMQACKETWNEKTCKQIKEALEQEPCDDAVSRGVVIQTLNKMDRYTATELTLCDTDKKFPANEVFIVDDVYEQIAEQLPSVTPQNHGKMLVCPSCGLDVHSDFKYCPRCGRKMQESEEV